MHLRHRLPLVVIFTLLAAAGLASQAARTATAPAEWAPATDKVLADAVGRGDVPGVVALVVDRSHVIYQGAFGMADTPSGRALTTDAIFRIASMTKAITSVAAMQLFEQGLFALDDPAGKYLPELRDLKVFDSFDSATGAYTLRPAKKTVTIRHLLTHTSGLGYNFTSPIVRDFKPRGGEQYPAGPLLFEPGDDWLYGTNTDWVGRLVETLSGKPLEAYFRERILDPLGMSDTFYNVPAEKQARVVAVHRRESAGKFGLDSVQPPLTVVRPGGGGGLLSTAADYARFLRMFLNNGRSAAPASCRRTRSKR